jgi:PadR family transcriptional regulator PadR
MSHSANLLKGILDLLILHVLNDRDCYVFELADLMEEYSGGLLTIQNATLYPSLYRLRDRGYITVEEKVVANRKRKYYHLRDLGKEYYREIKQEYLSLNEGVQNMLIYRKE